MESFAGAPRIGRPRHHASGITAIGTLALFVSTRATARSH